MVVEVKREPPIVSEEEIKEHISNVSSMKNNVDAIASQIAMIPALEMTI